MLGLVPLLLLMSYKQMQRLINFRHGSFLHIHSQFILELFTGVSCGIFKICLSENSLYGTLWSTDSGDLHSAVVTEPEVSRLGAFRLDYVDFIKGIKYNISNVKKL